MPKGKEYLDQLWGGPPIAQDAPPQVDLPVPPSTLSGWDIMQPRSRAFAMGQYKQRVGAEIKMANLRQQMGEKPAQLPQPEPTGFWKALDYMDRPRNAFQTAIASIVEGERDPSAIADRALAGLTGDERTHFSDILDRMAPEFQNAVMFPFESVGLSKNQARSIIGFGGDVMADPLLFLPVGKGVKLIGKGIKVARYSEAAEKLGLAPRIGEAESRLLKELRHMAFSRRRYEASGLAQKDIDFQRFIKPLRKEHRGLVFSLAEETNPREVVAFAESVRRSPETMGPLAEQVLSNNQRFRNPEAVRQLIALRSEDAFKTAVNGQYKLRNLYKFGKALQETEGRVVPELGSQLFTEQARLEKLFNSTAEEVITNEAKARMAKIETAKKVLQAKGGMLKTLVGTEKLGELAKFMGEIAPADAIAAPNSPQMVDKVLRSYFRKMMPGFIGGLRDIDKSRSSIQYMLDTFERGLTQSVRNNPKLAKIQEELAAQQELISRLPAWVPHVGSQAFVDRLSQLPSFRPAFGRFLRDPRTASDAIRRFQESGRPLASGEVESIHKAMEFKGELGALRKGGPILEVGPQERFAALLKNRPRQVAKVFDTDERIANEAFRIRTAKSVSEAEYLNEASRIFGQIPKGTKIAREQGKMLEAGREILSKIPESSHTAEELEKKGWLAIKDQRTLQMLPHLRGVYFDPDVLAAVVKGQQNFINPEKVLRFYDTMRDWWISYQLPLFPAFHLRNVPGNIAGMIAGGFLEDPRDTKDFVKASITQMAAWRKNPELLRKVHFYLKATDESITGDEAIQLALRHGAIGTGWFGQEIPLSVADAVDGIWRKGAGMLKVGSTKWAPVQAGKFVGRMIEDNAKFTFFMHRLRKGDLPIEAALKTKKFLGGFGPEDMSKIEQQVFRRVFPFYSWSRYNVPLQFEQILTNDRYRAKLLAIMRGHEAFRGQATQLDVADLPQDEIPRWMQESVPFPLKRDRDPNSPHHGEVLIFFLENWLPAADIDNFLSRRALSRFVMGQMAPPAQLLAQKAFGRVLYSDKPIEQRTDEFLGMELPTELVTALRTFRVLSWLDQNDFMGQYHNIRRYGEPTTAEKIMRNVGLTTFRLNPAKARSQYDTERLEILRDRTAALRSKQEGLEEKAAQKEGR